MPFVPKKWRDKAQGPPYTYVTGGDLNRIEQGVADATGLAEEGGASDEKIADLVVDPTTATGTALGNRFAPTGDYVTATDVTTEVSEALAAENLVKGEELGGDEFGVRFDDGAYFVRADETEGITSPVGGSRLTRLPEESGWSWVIMGNDRRALVGQRTDGSLYGMYEPPVPTLAPVQFVGDSLSANWSAYLPGVKTALDGRDVTTIGIGGQTSPQIAARQGGAPALLTVNGNTIPASGAVNVTAWSTNLLQITADGTRSIQGSLCGVAGTLTATRTTGPAYAYTFLRASAGAVVPCPPATPFQTNTGRGFIPIVCVGRNNISDTAESIVTQVRAMIGHAGLGKALVLSIPPKVTEINTPTTDRAKVDAINTALRDAFGAFWVDSAAHLRSADVLSSVGLTPTATDLQNITDGVTPESFRSDDLHYNAKAYEALTILIDNHFSSKGW